MTSLKLASGISPRLHPPPPLILASIYSQPRPFPTSVPGKPLSNPLQGAFLPPDRSWSCQYLVCQGYNHPRMDQATPRPPSVALARMGDWSPWYSPFWGAGALAYGLGLEVVIVSFAAAIDEAGAGIICLIIPPTMEKSQAGARFFGHTAYVCRETPELRI